MSFGYEAKYALMKCSKFFMQQKVYYVSVIHAYSVNVILFYITLSMFIRYKQNTCSRNFLEDFNILQKITPLFKTENYKCYLYIEKK